MLTGHIGTGKSAAGNFFIGKEVFISKRAFGRATIESAAETAVIAQHSVQIIDTPGFMDVLSSTNINVDELAHALVLSRNGIHAFGLVIDVSTRFDKGIASTLQELLSSFKDIIPYIFILFTKAGCLENGKKQLQITGKNEQVLRAKIEEMLADSACPSQLTELLELTSKQYMTLEAICYNEKSDYHEIKCNELVALVNQIQRKNGEKVLTSPLMNAAKKIYEEKCRTNKDGKEYNDTVGEIQRALAESFEGHKQEIKAGEMRSFWGRVAESVCQVVGTGVGVAVGLYFGQPVAGGLIGNSAGKLAGNVVDKKFCMQQ